MQPTGGENRLACKRSRVALASFAILLAATALGVAYLSSQPSRPTGVASIETPAQGDQRAALGTERNLPIHVGALSLPRVSLNPDDVGRAVGKLRMDSSQGLTVLLHAAMLFGFDMKVPGFPSSDGHPTLKEMLSNHELGAKYFANRPIFAKTRSGLRNPVRISPDADWQIERQAHPGQLLAEFAKQGVSLNHELITQAGLFHVRDLLRDAIANYSNEEPQIEWICMALALYSPPQTAWVDKFGHGFSFDDLSDDLLSRDLDSPELSCAGIHVLEALVLFLRVDDAYSILSKSHRDSVERYITNQVNHLVKTQMADGSWPKRWNLEGGADAPRPADGDADRHDRVHVTGHHLDWMLLLPRDMMPPESVFRRAVPWLLKCLMECHDRELLSKYCPYSHAAHVLKILASEPSPPNENEL